MKIVFLGTPDFAMETLRAIVEAGYEVIHVVTQPDREKGRGRELQMTPVKNYAVSMNIPVFQPIKIKSADTAAEMKSWDADLFVVAAFGRILSQEILDIPRLGCINVHASLLPKYRGAAPIQWSILNGDRETGITIMQMDAGIDTGDILKQVRVPITEEETGDSLFLKMSAAGAKLLVETLPLLENNQISPIKQQESEATYVKILDKEMGRIDWLKDAGKIELQIRGLNSWPGAYCTFRGKILKIWKAKVAKEEDLYEEGFNVIGGVAPGEAALVTKDGIYIRTGKGLLCLMEIQLESKKRMMVKDFLLGYPVQVGDRFRA